MATYEDLEKVEIRVGRVVEVYDFPEARKPAYVLLIDFGDEIGVKKSSAQLPNTYEKNELVVSAVRLCIGRRISLMRIAAGRVLMMKSRVR